MEFGIFSESGHRNSADPAAIFDADVAEIVLADELGFREAWIAEPNHVRPNTVTHAHMLMCRAAALTEQIRFGSGIRQLPLHHPVDVVQEANMCDQVTHGRYIFGYGGTHLASMHQLYQRGIDVRTEDSRAMVYESIDVILKCWNSPAPFDFEGRFWQGHDVDVHPRPFQKPHPPIATACTGSRATVEMAAQHGFIPLFGRGNDRAEDIRAMSNHYVHMAEQAGLASSRRSFHVTHMVYVAETDRQARADTRAGANRIIEERKREPHLLKLVPPGGSLDDVTFDFMADAGYYWVGSPDTVYEQIKQYFEDSGGFGTLLVTAGLDHAAPDKIARSMRLLMEEVAPRLVDLDPDRVPSSLATR